MFGIFFGIAAAIAAGALIAYAVAITIQWLRNKIKEMFAKKNVRKVCDMSISKLIEECPNEVSLDTLLDDGYTNVLASVDNNGNIQDVEVVKDIGYGDEEVDRLLGEQGMVVVTN